MPQRALPQLLEVFEFEGIAELIGAPLEVQFQESDFIDVKKEFPNLIARWESVQVQRLLALLPARPSNRQYTVSPLELAVNVLKCGHCSTFVLYSDALAHGCATTFSQKDLTFWESVSDIIRDIILTLGLDPHSTTDNDLDNLDPRILCIKCAPTLSKNGKKCRLARSWRACVSRGLSYYFVIKYLFQVDHFLLDHTNATELQWQVLDQVQTKQMKVAEGTHEDHNLHAWFCKICVGLTTKDLLTYAATVNHLRLVFVLFIRRSCL